jgi:hypothetical protein
MKDQCCGEGCAKLLTSGSRWLPPLMTAAAFEEALARSCPGRLVRAPIAAAIARQQQDMDYGYLLRIFHIILAAM